MDTFFRITTSDVEFELEGSEAFVRGETARFLPHLGGESPPAIDEPPVSALQSWFADRVPRGQPPSMQDSILIFGYFLKREKDQHMFSPSDIKRSFTEVGRTIPKSLLQIMGTLKRGHGLLCSPGEMRGRYALAPEGIHHVEHLLGIAAPKKATAKAPVPTEAPAAPSEPIRGPAKWEGLFKPGEPDGGAE